MGDRLLQRLRSHQVGELSGMVMRSDVVLIDLTFLLKATEGSFYGAPLILGPQEEDFTVLYGVTRGLLRLRKSVGIKRAIVVIGSEASAVAAEGNINKIVRLLTRLRTSVTYEPKARTGSICKCLAPAAR